MDIQKVGTAIAYLRKRAGYTQKDLADRIGVSDKAVSKWERGLGLPDTSLLGKLSILLDTDTDSLLAGDVVCHGNGWCGLLVLNAISNNVTVDAVIYDKPLFSYLLGYFLLVGIKDIYVVASNAEIEFISANYGNGAQFGINIVCCGDKIENAAACIGQNCFCTNVMVVFDKTFIYGVDQTRFFQKAMRYKDRATILSLPKKMVNSRRLFFDSDKKVIRSDRQDRNYTQYDYYEIPVMFFPKRLIENADFVCNSELFTEKISYGEEVYTEVLDRGYVEITINSAEKVREVSAFVKTVQEACGMLIYCIEEIAWRRGMINAEQLKEFGLEKTATIYGQYILSLCKQKT